MAKRKGINHFGHPWLGSHFFLVSFHGLNVAFGSRNRLFVSLPVDLRNWSFFYYHNRSLRDNCGQQTRTERKLPLLRCWKHTCNVKVFLPPFVFVFIVDRLSGFVVCLARFSVVVLLRPKIVLLSFCRVLAAELHSLSVCGCLFGCSCAICCCFSVVFSCVALLLGSFALSSNIYSVQPSDYVWWALHLGHTYFSPLK